MNITVNGEPRDLDDPVVVADLMPDETRGLAVAVNGSVVPRDEHASRALAEGDVVEIVTATQGG